MTKKSIKYISAQEFREIGFLQEANRIFFHPLGLALEVKTKRRNWWQWLLRRPRQWVIGGCWDYRDDPEGICFGNKVDEDKIARVDAERERHVAARIELFGAGTIIQPPGWEIQKSKTD